MTLHDLTGRFLRELVVENGKRPGDYQTRLSLEGIAQGAYLVAFRTDKGETAVQRIVVQ